ncbi:hypothetical protein FIM12_04975 [SAR202 cluster bacterium AD-804-J14_MRT_500m]|nr:hypothetical protein [SAR202 cluster bacterium AD-804-J14_MRT_500m]
MDLINPLDSRIGEIIGADSIGLSIQCYRLYDSPALGSMISVGDPSVYAVVSEIRTEGLDPSRPVIARGRSEISEEAVYLNNPQLSELLTTRFRALIIGHQTNGLISVGLPPFPPRIHAFVWLCKMETIKELTSTSSFLRLLLDSGVPDEVVAACVRIAASILKDEHQFKVKCTKALAMELVGQTSRLNAMLRRLA